MITFEQVQQARQGDNFMYSQIYQYFFDSRVPAWLYNKGIKSTLEREDMLGMLTDAFVRVMQTYKSQKIVFEKYVWKIFKFTFITYFQNKTRHKRVFGENIEARAVFNLGSVDINMDTEIDIEIFLTDPEIKLSTKRVLKAMMEYGSPSLTPEEKNISLGMWYYEREKLQENFKEYSYK